MNLITELVGEIVNKSPDEALLIMVCFGSHVLPRCVKVYRSSTFGIYNAISMNYIDKDSCHNNNNKKRNTNHFCHHRQFTSVILFIKLKTK